jgi:ABC-type lipoprotein release transport system permease subunit
VSYLAAFLGIGTVVGLVNLTVGILSACWLTYQLYVAIKYDLPIKRAKLAAAQRGQLDATQPGDLS